MNNPALNTKIRSLFSTCVLAVLSFDEFYKTFLALSFLSRKTLLAVFDEMNLMEVLLFEASRDKYCKKIRLDDHYDTLVVRKWGSIQTKEEFFSKLWKARSKHLLNLVGCDKTTGLIEEPILLQSFYDLFLKSTEATSFYEDLTICEEHYQLVKKAFKKKKFIHNDPLPFVHRVLKIVLGSIKDFYVDNNIIKAQYFQKISKWLSFASISVRFLEILTNAEISIFLDLLTTRLEKDACIKKIKFSFCKFGSEHSARLLFDGLVSIFGIEDHANHAFLSTKTGNTRKNKKHKLEEIEFLNFTIEKHLAKILANKLTPLLLAKITLNSNQLSDPMLSLILEPLIYSPNNLTHLTIQHNCLDTESGLTLSNVLAAQTCNLKHLDLSHNDFGNKFAMALAYGIKKNKSLEYLNISNSCSEATETKALAQAIKTQNSIKTLVFNNWYNNLESIEVMMKCLSRTPSIENLTATGNYLTSRKTIFSMCAMLKKPSFKSLIVDFSASRHIGKLDPVFDALAEANSLQTLEIKRSRFNDYQAVRIAQFLKQSSSGNFSYLNLSHNNITTEGAKCILEVLKTLSHKPKIDLSYNLISEAFAQAYHGDAGIELKTDAAYSSIPEHVVPAGFDDM